MKNNTNKLEIVTLKACSETLKLRNFETNLGFTFLEMIVVTAISSIFILGLVALNTLVGDSQRIININTQSVNEANLAIDALVRELRNARTAASGAYPIELADDQQIIFYANIDADAEPERIRYFLSGTELTKGVTQPTGTPPVYTGTEDTTLVINYVQNGTNPIFYYYNGDWPADTINNPLPAPARLVDTKLIMVDVTINPLPSRPESAYTLESAAQIRNLKTNL